MSSTEVEIKFLVTDLKHLTRALRAAGFRITERRAHEIAGSNPAVLTSIAVGPVLVRVGGC